MLDHRQRIEAATSEPNKSVLNDPLLRTAVEDTLHQLDQGQLRVAHYEAGTWQVNTWIKQAILLYMQMQPNRVMGQNSAQYFDKIPLKYDNMTAEDFTQARIRVVPPAHIRYGAYVAPQSVIMPSYINIGAYVGQGSMIDTWATVGSCAQIGQRVHLSGGAGIGGVLEPLQARPTIIENDCFIGARSEIVEGVIVEQHAVIAMGVFISQSTKIYDRTNGKIYQGRVPAGAVVVPGSLPAPDGTHSLSAAIIVKYADPSTREKVSINELLREI
ncbi:MAG: 2,3,4,5-tetrahydropyridine-2,6-dicarboxylate N-succinyltransferase [Legionellales bacterium]|nr:2,3,4,5-tetrahydropyridine-2,6-dicarboxylate N-succinyltransferase [Legionellales bacterium]